MATGRQHAQNRRLFSVATALCVALLMVASSCGNGSDSTATTSSTIDSSTSSTTSQMTTPSSDIVDSTTTSAATTTSSSAASTTTTTQATTTTVGPITIDPTWASYDDEFVVWGVASNDVLNVRSGPGVSYGIITDLAANAGNVHRYDKTARVGTSVWGVIEVPGGGGWVNLAYLRPAGTRPPTVVGTIIPSVETAADDVQARLGARDYEILSGFIDPSRGLVISPYAYVGDAAQVLTPAQVAGAATDDSILLWGYTDGEGAPIKTTIDARFRVIAGSTALTSTDAIGFDIRLGLGNSIDNIAERFPGASVVEYHFEGTSLYGDFDWTSVRLVFDPTNLAPTGRPALLAIVQDTWTI